MTNESDGNQTFLDISSKLVRIKPSRVGSEDVIVCFSGLGIPIGKFGFSNVFDKRIESYAKKCRREMFIGFKCIIG